MSFLVASIAGCGLLAIVLKGFYGLTRRWRSGPANNWRNEAYTARSEAGSWAESELAPGNGAQSAPASVLNGIGG